MNKKQVRSIIQFKKGQALVTLLVFMAMATTITAGAVAVTIINSQSTGKFALGEETLHIAEAGADNAILRLLRNPSYSGGETLTVGNGTATITVSSSGSNRTITSEGVNGNFRRRIQVAGSFSGNAFTVSSWSEID